MVSQFAVRSLRSATTSSSPRPQSIRSRVLSRANTSSAPPPARTRSRPRPGVIVSRLPPPETRSAPEPDAILSEPAPPPATSAPEPAPMRSSPPPPLIASSPPLPKTLVVAGPAEDPVVARIAGRREAVRLVERALAVAGDRVVARPAVDQVVAGKADHRVVAGDREDVVVFGRAEERVVAVRAGDGGGERRRRAREHGDGYSGGELGPSHRNPFRGPVGRPRP